MSESNENPEVDPVKSIIPKFIYSVNRILENPFNLENSLDTVVSYESKLDVVNNTLTTRIELIETNDEGEPSDKNHLYEISKKLGKDEYKITSKLIINGDEKDNFIIEKNDEEQLILIRENSEISRKYIFNLIKEDLIEGDLENIDLDIIACVTSCVMLSSSLLLDLQLMDLEIDLLTDEEYGRMILNVVDTVESQGRLYERIMREGLAEAGYNPDEEANARLN